MLPIKHLWKVVGHLRPDKTFVTHRKPLHYFRKYQGFGMSYAVIKQLRDRGCCTICLIYTNDKGLDTVYFTTPETLIEKGILYKDKEADTQLILRTKDWHKHTG